MRDRAGAGRAVVQPARAGLGGGDDLARRPPRLLRVDHQDDRALGEQPDRCEALQRVVAGVLVDHRADDLAGRAAHQQRGAVGFGARRLAGAQRVAGAAPIVDDKALAEPGRELLGQQPRHHVDHAAGDRRHDDLHRAARVALRLRGQGRESGSEQERNQTGKTVPPVSRPPRAQRVVGRVGSRQRPFQLASAHRRSPAPAPSRHSRGGGHAAAASCPVGRRC